MFVAHVLCTAPCSRSHRAPACACAGCLLSSPLLRRGRRCLLQFVLCLVLGQPRGHTETQCRPQQLNGRAAECWKPFCVQHAEDLHKILECIETMRWRIHKSKCILHLGLGGRACSGYCQVCTCRHTQGSLPSATVGRCMLADNSTSAIRGPPAQSRRSAAPARRPSAAPAPPGRWSAKGRHKCTLRVS
jgi:hypothetical protein